MTVLALGIWAIVAPINNADAANSCGRASWYALKSRTASGEMMNPSAMTAAHKTLPFGTRVKVTNKKNGKSVIVRINDRGPFIKGRIIDVSKAAAVKIGMIKSGHAPVCFSKL
ncbi:MAG: septal ring lytic transglycosylase RlpA family protein [Ahrensia sp.]|nr:septal ring lytic transglycosylase RlpA family protein [Ahrensia sp.]